MKKKYTTQPPPSILEVAPPDHPQPSIPEIRKEDHPTTPDGGFDLDAPRVPPDHEIEVTDDGEPFKGLILAKEPGVIPAEKGDGQVSAPTPPEATDLAPTTPSQTDGGVTGSGKAPLPDFEDENDPTGEDEPDPVFTEQDEKDFPLLEARVERGAREAFTAVREIRLRKLFRLIRDDEGKPKYRRFDAYVEQRLGHRRQWVTQATNWLLYVETMEALGVENPPPLTVDAAQGLLPGRLPDAGGLLAVLREAQEDGVALSKNNLREIVVRRSDFFKGSRKDGPDKPAAADYPAYKRDCSTAKRLGGKGKYGLVTDARSLPGDVGDNLVALCKERHALPRREDVVNVATGPDLERLVESLLPVARKVADVEEMKARLATRKTQIRAMLREGGGVAKLKEEVKALEAELVAEGALPKKGKAKGKTEDGGGASEAAGMPQPPITEGDGETPTHEEGRVYDDDPAPVSTEKGDEQDEDEEPNLGVLGVLEIGPGAVAKAEADAFCSVSAVDRIRKLLVCGRWDRRSKDAASRGIAVLVIPELQEGSRP